MSADAYAEMLALEGDDVLMMNLDNATPQHADEAFRPSPATPTLNVAMNLGAQTASTTFLNHLTARARQQRCL